MRLSHAAIIVGCSACATHAIGADLPFLPVEPVVLSGDALEDLGPDFHFQTHRASPVLNGRGAVAMHAIFSGPGVEPGNDRGIFRRDNGPLELLIRSGDRIPGGEPDELFDTSPLGVNLGDADSLAFRAILRGDGVSGDDDRAIFAGPAADLQVAMRTGSTPPGGTAPFQRLDYRPVQNDSGQVAVLGDLHRNRSFRSLWSGAPDALRRVAETEMFAPGYGRTGTFGSTFASPVIANDGSVAFVASVDGAAPGTGVGLFKGDADDLRLVARRSQFVPGLGAIDHLDQRPSMSGAGHLSFAIGMEVNEDWYAGLVRQPSGQNNLEVVHSGFDTLPGTPAGSTTERIEYSTINDRSAVAFIAKLHTGGDITLSNDKGIWLADDGGIGAVLREGESVPGLAEWEIGPISIFTQLNEKNQLGIAASLIEPGGDARAALLGWDPDGGITPIAVAGEPFRVAPDDVRTVRFIDVADAFDRRSAGPAGAGGGPRALNDDGLLTFGLRFEDDTAGVFTTVVPAPATPLAALGGLLTLSRRRRAP